MKVSGERGDLYKAKNVPDILRHSIYLVDVRTLRPLAINLFEVVFK